MASTADMTAGNPTRQMVRFSIPVLLGSTVEMIHSMADSVVLGRLIGINAFAAVGASAFAYWMVFCVTGGMASGFSSVYARKFGAKDWRGLNLAVAMSLWLVVVTGVVLGAMGVLGAGPLLALLDTPPAIAKDAKIYLQIRLASLIIAFGRETVCALFRALGNSRTPFIANALSIAVNIALNLLFVLATSLGVAGVALATAAAQLAACAFCAIRLKGAGVVRITRADLRPNAGMLRELISIGLPLGFRDLPSAVLSLVIQRKVNGFGTAYVAGVAAAKQLHSVLFSVGDACSAALGAFTGQNFGAKKYERIAQGARSMRGITLACACAMIALMLPLRRFALSLFITGDGADVTDALKVGVRQLNVVLCLLPCFYMAVLQREYLRGLGDGRRPLISGLVEAATRAVSITALPPLIGEWGLYITEAIGWPFMMAYLMFSQRAVMRRVREQDNKSQSTGGVHAEKF